MAQQARPNVAGHMDVLRANPTICSTVVRANPAGSFSSSPISGPPPGWAAGYGWWWCGSVPFEASAAPFVDVGDGDVHQEEDDRDQTEPTQDRKSTRLNSSHVS